MALRVRCPYCGAEYEVPEGTVYAVCPFCGTVVELATGRRPPQQYYPPRLEEQDAFAAAVSRASQLPGAPRGLAGEAAPMGSELHYVPLYVCRAEAREASGLCPTAAEVLERAVLAARPGVLPGLGHGYRFPSAGRTAFDPEKARGAVFHQAELDPGEACREAVEEAASAARGEALLSGCSGEVEVSHQLLGVAHYPFWLIRYTHSSAPGQSFTALVDAVDATVVYVEYPIPMAGRERLAGLAALALGASAGAAAAVAAALHTPLALLSGAAAGLAAAAPFLARAVARKGTYRYHPPRVQKTVTVLEEERRA